VQHLLGSVRGGIRRNASLMGFLLICMSAAVVFWITTGVDIGWFALQKLELPVGLRAILLAVMVPAGLWLIATRVVYPWVRQIQEDDVARLLERRFPVFQSRLMTCVHASHGYPGNSPMVVDMLRRTASEAGSIATNVNADQVFDRRQLKRQGSITATLLVSIVVMAFVSPEAMQRWWSAFVRCAPTYHVRTTQLDVVVIAQPGDRQVPFRPLNDEFIYMHPRAADLQLQLTVPTGGPDSDHEWVVPERVRVDVVRNDGSRSRSFVSLASGRTFRFALTRLQEDVRIELLAGDFRTTVPYRIACVTPPGIDSMTLKCRYPEYTGWNQLRETDVPVLGSEVALPLFTEFELQATSNKSLQSARVVTDWFELTGDLDSARLIPREGFPGKLSHVGPLLEDDGRTIRATFHVLLPSDNAAAVSEGDRPKPAGLPIASNTAVRFFLHDTDNVLSTTPEVLRIRGVGDQPPTIVTKLTGIGNAVTRRARIPVAGTIRDEYGLASAGFEFLVDDETHWRPRPFRGQPVVGTTEFRLHRSPDEPFEVFDLQPLDLSEGQSMTLTVTAADRNDLTGPGVSRGEPIMLRVVSNEELLSLLYTREINLRRRFEGVIEQLEQTRDDLLFHREFAARLDSGDPAIIRVDDAIAVNTCATRSSNNLRRQQNELLSIVEGFEEIVQQLINNAIPPQQLADNMRAQILTPLQNAAANSIPTADRAVSAFRAATMQRQPSEELVTIAADRLSGVIRELKQILESVRDMAEFHEALRDLKSILEEQERLLDETRQMQKRNLIDKLKLLN
jgi:hypothetical protein